MTKTIEIIVSPSGQSRVETKGFTGAECREASQFIEQALGQRTTHRRVSPARRQRPIPTTPVVTPTERTRQNPIKRLRFPRPGNTDRRLQCPGYRRRAPASDLSPHERHQVECGPVIPSAPGAHLHSAARHLHRPARSTAPSIACDSARGHRRCRRHAPTQPRSSLLG